MLVFPNHGIRPAAEGHHEELAQPPETAETAEDTALLLQVEALMQWLPAHQPDFIEIATAWQNIPHGNTEGLLRLLHVTAVLLC